MTHQSLVLNLLAVQPNLAMEFLDQQPICIPSIVYKRNKYFRSVCVCVCVCVCFNVDPIVMNKILVCIKTFIYMYANFCIIFQSANLV